MLTNLLGLRNLHRLRRKEVFYVLTSSLILVATRILLHIAKRHNFVVIYCLATKACFADTYLGSRLGQVLVFVGYN